MTHLVKLVCASTAIASVAAKCNPEIALQAPSLAPGLTANVGNLTFLPQAASTASTHAACLDGSPYGFYFVPSTTGSTKWTVSINGGGWCYDEVDCYCRSQNNALGTSTVLPPTEGCACMNPNEDGTMDTDCNCIHLPYSDGASFSGYRAEPWSVPEGPGVPAGSKVWFRGIKNLDGVMDFAFAHGMKDATEFVVTGGSAGGLSTFLHADRFAARLAVEAPAVKKVRAAPVVGYFLDHDNYAHTTGFPGGPNTPQWSTPGKGANYTEWMKYIYTMQNLTFGADGGLTEKCLREHPDAPHLCFMSPHMQDVIETPFFMFNSKYDAWQLGNEFQSNWVTADEQKGVLQYGEDFLAQLAPVHRNGSPHGGMITSCICHGCPWGDLVLEGKNSYQYYADWFYGKTAGGAASMHIDPSLPNGNGALAGGPFQSCKSFPNQTAALGAGCFQGGIPCTSGKDCCSGHCHMSTMIVGICTYPNKTSTD